MQNEAPTSISGRGSLGTHCECEFEERKDGEWVRYEDFRDIVRELSDTNKKELKENKQLKEEIKRLNEYIEDKDNRINRTFGCDPHKIHNKSKEGNK